MVRSGIEAEAPASEAGIVAAHSSDEHCAPHLDEHGECRICGTLAGDPCRYCGGESSHQAECPTLIEAPSWIAGDQPPDICNRCGHAGYTFSISDRTGEAHCPKCGSTDIEEVER